MAKPGVYTLPQGARLQDVVQQAGGFLSTAEDRAINLAMKVQDEMSIYVPAQGEEMPAGTAPAAPAPATAPGNEPVNLNTADEAALMELPGIGPAKAAAIIAYRTENGPFASADELTEVSGIGEKTFEQLKDFITAR